MKLVLILIFTLFFYRGVRAESCTVSLDSVNSLLRGSAFKNKVEESPFIMACKQPPGLLQGRPETGLFRRSVVSQDSQGRKTKELLSKVIAKVRARISDSTNQMNNIKACMDKTTPECAELKKWVDSDLPQFVKAARFNLSLGQSQAEVKTWVGKASKTINLNLDNLGSYKYENWNPLSQSEADRANAQLTKYVNQINTEATKELNDHQISSQYIQKFKEDALLTVRYQHYQAYHQMISELPILQYLKGPDVNYQDLLKAFGQMQNGLKKESQQLDELQADLDKNPIPTDALKVLNYNSELEEVLLENNKDCGLATSLVYTMSNRELGNGLAIGLPVLAASIFAAPAVLALGGSAALAAATSLGIGALGSTHAIVKSYDAFKVAQGRVLGQIYGESDMDQLQADQTSRRLKYDVVTLPVGFGLGGYLIRGLSVGVNAMRAGRFIFAATNG